MNLLEINNLLMEIRQQEESLQWPENQKPYKPINLKPLVYKSLLHGEGI
jgi:hypothetical protein